LLKSLINYNIRVTLLVKWIKRKKEIDFKLHAFATASAHVRHNKNNNNNTFVVCPRVFFPRHLLSFCVLVISFKSVLVVIAIITRSDVLLFPSIVGSVFVRPRHYANRLCIVLKSSLLLFRVTALQSVFSSSSFSKRSLKHRNPMVSVFFFLIISYFYETDTTRRCRDILLLILFLSVSF